MNSTTMTWRAWPLTPIHVGDGSTLTPDEWTTEGNHLARFAASLVMASLRPDQRKSFMKKLDAGQLDAARDELRRYVRPEHVIERTAIAVAERRDIEASLSNAQRSNEIHPFVRSGATPYLPGSSLKGAIRTALLSQWATGSLGAIEDLKRQKRNHRGALDSSVSMKMQEMVFSHTSTDQDPLRFLSVADAALPADATLVDRVRNWRPGKDDPAKGMRMFFECVRSLAAGGAVPSCTLAMRIDSDRLRAARGLDHEGRKTPGRDLDPAEVIRAVNAFHWELFDYEREKFFADERETLQRLDRLVRVRDGQGRILPPAELRAHPAIMLLRVGRFTQFESKSIAGAREGWNAQAKPPCGMKEGKTRNVVRIDGVPMPMGWLLLCPHGFAIDALPEARDSTAEPGRAAGSRAPARALPSEATYQGEPVEIIGVDGDTIGVRFADGDTDWVPRDEVEF